MKIVAVTACPTGIAHTYMAQEAIEKEAAKRGYQVMVETQGSMGIENELEQEDVDDADFVILAVAIGIEGEERFEEKDGEGKVFTVDPGEVIKHPSEVFDKVEKL
ncbi:PTS fructose transporter subunit IIB [Enterococcus sp. MJM12]|uniref:PTS fructose transporter subunit IIB n=1 Tax=Candidatus Enterococcus myersii TaxID=2815322 RepID=A0ABS3H6I7_9ENTE|nr:PTS fructose transporter subunit IIB [Enterococcus sp. MJM12]MBO0448748.1 PTS fructose transporter subunit IIB [Enterococcus sp. MJM12]